MDNNGYAMTAEKACCLFTVLMPCRNEKSTVGPCVAEALRLTDGWVFTSGAGEVLVVDNGSEDGSGEIARKAGARVVREERLGYGNALRRGIKESLGEVILITDCDTTYDMKYLREMERMIRENGYDMVIGDRFAGGIEKGAMPLSHKWGVRFLSWLGRLRFHTKVRDFHCGQRAFSREAAQSLSFQTEGMEFATEMIAKAAKLGLRIGQVPVTLRKCDYERKSKLRTIRDGMRHLQYILRG